MLEKLKEYENRIDELQIQLNDLTVKFERDREDAWKMVADITNELEFLRKEVKYDKNKHLGNI
jgi:hypothetical protein